jgi:hypothetical protein
MGPGEHKKSNSNIITILEQDAEKNGHKKIRWLNSRVGSVPLFFSIDFAIQSQTGAFERKCERMLTSQTTERED